MVGPKVVKPSDLGLWHPRLAEYRPTALILDTVPQGTLRPDLTGAFPEVVATLAGRPAAAYLQLEHGVTQVVLGPA